MNGFDSVEEALEELRNGKIILVTDDPDRENEGDLVCAAEFATQENINFMATYAKGLICTPMSAEIAARLNFPPMVAENTDNHSTARTVLPLQVCTGLQLPLYVRFFPEHRSSSPEVETYVRGV